MVIVRVVNGFGRRCVIHFYAREVDLPIVKHSKSISALAISKERTTACTEGNLRQAGSPDPGLDREVLQLQIGRVPNGNAVKVAIKLEALIDYGGGEGGITQVSAMVIVHRIKWIGFASPPTDNSRGRGDARA